MAITLSPRNPSDAPFTASKNHKHSLNNPYSQFRSGWSTEQVMAAPGVTNELTKFMCSPTSVRANRGIFAISDFEFLQDGAACCIIASEDFVHQHGLENQAIEIVGNALVTDGVETFEGRSAIELVGFTMTRRCADEVFSQAGFPKGEGRDQVAVVELHDCFASNEVGFLDCPRVALIKRQLITYDALRLCLPGGAVELVERGDNTVLSVTCPAFP
jgi:sterol carrier protein 2